MKKFFAPLILCCSVVSFAAEAVEETTWKLDGDTIWSRDKDVATLSREDGNYLIKHTGEKDYAVVLHKNIPVEPGDTFRISFNVENEGPGAVMFAVGMYDGANKIISWTQGKASQSGPCTSKTLTDEFVIPWGGAAIVPRIMGHGIVSAKCRNFKLEKLEKTALLDPVREIPEAGAEPLNLIPQGKDFAKSLQFKGKKAFVNQRGRIPRPFLDPGNRYNDTETWKIAGADGLDYRMLPLEPFKVQPGDKIFLSLRLFVDRGSPVLAVFPWTGGMIGEAPFATGTFRPMPGEELGVWCCIHAYLTVPEGVEGMIPAVVCDGGAVFNVAEWTISRPSDAELNPVRQKVEGFAKERKDENFDRGVVAVRTGKDVYLSWRLLKTDKDGVGFDVFRIVDGKEQKINQQPITKTTDFVDKDAPEGVQWTVRNSAGGTTWAPNTNTSEGTATLYTPNSPSTTPVGALDKPYRSIPLKGTDSFASIAFADLDGDGQTDFVIKTPNANIDPWYMYWYKSPETYKLQAYKSDGTFLWEHDLGWGIERGIWYSPYIVADFDNDGCAEIAVKTCPGDFRNSTGRVYDGPEFLSILDGKTGKERTKLAWPERDGLAYNYSNRHQLCRAYLDGKTPCIVAVRGTYNRQTVVAYQLSSPDRLEKLWTWDNRWERELGRWGQGAHTTHAVDLDGDGRDEIILGSIALDDDGSVLWEQKLGHPDHVYVGDIDPSRPGLEVVYGIETGQKKNGVCMVDGKTGEVLWGLDQRTYHIHSTGMVSDIDPQSPGAETWSGEENSETDRWIRSAKGEYLPIPEKFPVKSLAPKSVWWTGDLQRRLIIGNKPVEYPSFEPTGDTQFEGDIRMVADLYGDWREEVVTSCKGEIRIYTTTIPAKDRRVTFLQDPNYRATMIEDTMGYPQIPLPSLDLLKSVK